MDVRRGWVVALILLVAGAAITAVAIQWARPAFARFDEGGVSFNYPATWTIHDHLEPTTGFGSPIAILGTVAWGPCPDFDESCHAQERLAPGQIEVEVDEVGLFTDGNFCAFAREPRGVADPSDPVVRGGAQYLLIDDHPTLRVDTVVQGRDEYLSDGWREWRIGDPTSPGGFDVSAKWRGPGSDVLLADLDRLVASLGLPGLENPLATCGSPFPAPSAGPS